MRATPDAAMTCRHCGASLNPLTGTEARFLASAVRERFARDARLTAGHRRFVRD
jgi:hypothetical protein